MSENLTSCFVLILLFFGRCCHGQSTQADSLFSQFRADILTELQEHKERVVWDYDTRRSYYSLLINCSVEKLVKYTDDSIPAVRAEIFGGLIGKNADLKILRDILSRHVNDTASFMSSPTDNFIKWTVGGYMKFTVDWRSKHKARATDYKARLRRIDEEGHFIIPGMSHSLIDKDSLLRIDSLVFSEKAYKIIAFELTIGEVTIKTNNVFTAPIKEMIQKMRPGQFIFFDNIKAEVPDKSIRSIGSVALRIK
jgi:hypothetical protein